MKQLKTEILEATATTPDAQIDQKKLEKDKEPDIQPPKIVDPYDLIDPFDLINDFLVNDPEYRKKSIKSYVVGTRMMLFQGVKTNNLGVIEKQVDGFTIKTCKIYNTQLFRAMKDRIPDFTKIFGDGDGRKLK